MAASGISSFLNRSAAVPTIPSRRRGQVKTRRRRAIDSAFPLSGPENHDVASAPFRVMVFFRCLRDRIPFRYYWWSASRQQNTVFFDFFV